MNTKKAVFLDRDGTINIEKNYLYRIEDFKFIPRAEEAIRNINLKGYMVIIVTNQAGIGRGFYTEEDLYILHKWMCIYLKSRKAIIDDIYYCPHHNENGLGMYKVNCSCRKPKTGMIDRAIRKYNINPYISFTIGDKESDILAGKSAGTKTILLRTGYGKNIINSQANYICNNLYEAVQKVIAYE